MRREEAIEIYKTEMKRWESTRSIQWKFNIGIWTVLALAINYKKELGFNEYSQACYILIAFLISIIILGIHFRFVNLIQFSLEVSKEICRDIRDGLNNKIEKEENILFNIPTTPAHKGPNHYKWIWLQVSITLLLLLIFWIRNI